jgi:hypothetical protein
LRYNRRYLDIVAAIAALVIFTLVGLSFYVALSHAQSPTGGSQFPEAPTPGNLIVSLGLDYKTGQPKIFTLVYSDNGFVPCGTDLNGKKFKCGKVARIVKGTNKLGRPVWAIKLTRSEKLVAVYYDYAMLNGEGNINCHDWTSPFKQSFLRQTSPGRGDKVCGNVGPAAQLDFLQVEVKDSRFHRYVPPPSPESGGLVGPNAN